MKEQIALVVDDEPDLAELIAFTLKKMQIQSAIAPSVARAKELLQNQNFNFCITDLKLPDGDGIMLLEHIKVHLPNMPVAIITAYGNIEKAILAIKKGAIDFITKPLDLNTLRALVKTALTQNKKSMANIELIGNSAVINEIRFKISKFALSKAPIHIFGPSGSGKELIAKLIHKESNSQGPFIAINCGAIPKELMESELFGYKKGSFTGAVQEAKGLLQAANNGTLFLDEVAELPLEMQVKLLRVLQEKSTRQLGATNETPLNTRIISASNKNLKALVLQGKFREDLFYRLHVLDIVVPGLQERLSDLEPLIQHFLHNINIENNFNFILSEAALVKLKNYSFRGNIRELENILERACALATNNIITPETLALTALANNLPTPVDQTFNWKQENLESYINNIEKNVIITALEKCRYDKAATAAMLGISLRALRYKLLKLNIMA